MTVAVLGCSGCDFQMSPGRTSLSHRPIAAVKNEVCFRSVMWMFASSDSFEASHDFVAVLSSDVAKRNTVGILIQRRGALSCD